jgi:pyruvate,water dikinase
LWFIDYNRILHKSLEFNLPPIGEANIDEEALEQVLVQGATGSPGIARGRVRIAPAEVLADIEIGEDEILVCAMTSPHYLPLMAKCAGIVTDQGGMLSHAAIICRELGKPCVVGTKKATEVLVEGMEVVVDADSGRVYKI